MMNATHVDLGGHRELVIEQVSNTEVLLSITNSSELTCYADLMYLADKVGLREHRRQRISGVQWGISYHLPFWKNTWRFLDTLQETAREILASRYEVVHSTSGRCFILEKSGDCIFVGTESYLESNIAAQLVVQSALKPMVPTMNFKNLICENGGMLIGVGFKMGSMTYNEVKSKLQNYAC